MRTADVRTGRATIGTLHCENPLMSELADDKTRTDLLNRPKRAEGQLRGVQRMAGPAVQTTLTRQQPGPPP